MSTTAGAWAKHPKRTKMLPFQLLKVMEGKARGDEKGIAITVANPAIGPGIVGRRAAAKKARSPSRED